jgi:hypothetical protein
MAWVWPMSNDSIGGVCFAFAQIEMMACDAAQRVWDIVY